MSKFYKDISLEVVKGENDTDLVAIISSDQPDRDNDILHPKGMIKKTHPMFLWLHGFDPTYRLPLGKVLWTKKASKKREDGTTMKVVKAGFQFDDSYFPQTVKRMYIEKSLRYFSVGADALEWARREDEDYGYDFLKWDLVEISAVPVPSNIDTGESKKYAAAWQEDYQAGQFGEVPERILRHFDMLGEGKKEEEIRKEDLIKSSSDTAEKDGNQSAVEVVSFPLGNYAPAVEKDVVRFPVAKY